MKLSPEEIERRRHEHFKKSAAGADLIEKTFGVNRSIDPNKYQDLLREYQDSFPLVCEHEKSMVEDCMACDEIFKQCFPENCFKCEFCQTLYVNEEEVNEWGICDECRYNNDRTGDE